MELTCPKCGNRIAASDINDEKSIVKCNECGELFPLTPQDSVAAPSTDAVPRMPLVVPEGCTIADTPSELRITRRWLGKGTAGVISITIMWNAILVGAYYFLQSIGLLSEGIDSYFPFVLFGVLFSLIGICLIFHTISQLVNRTIIRVTAGELTIRHVPFSICGTTVIKAARIDQLYCKGTGSDSSAAYQVYVRLRTGINIEVCSLPSMTMAAYIEEQVESRLGITNRPIPGEMRRVDLLDSHLPANAPAVSSCKPSLPQPVGIALSRHGDALLFVRGWMSIIYLIPLVISIITIVAGAWNYSALVNIPNLPTMGIVITLPLFFLYIGLCAFNRTHIRVDSAWLTVHHGPIPAAKSLRIAVSDIDQLFVERQLHSASDSVHYVYPVFLMTKDGGLQRLPFGFTDLTNYEEALFIEQEIERHLRIADRKMDGEYNMDDERARARWSDF